MADSGTPDGDAAGKRTHGDGGDSAEKGAPEKGHAPGQEHGTDGGAVATGTLVTGADEPAEQPEQPEPGESAAPGEPGERPEPPESAEEAETPDPSDAAAEEAQAPEPLGRAERPEPGEPTGPPEPTAPGNPSEGAGPSGGTGPSASGAPGGSDGGTGGPPAERPVFPAVPRWLVQMPYLLVLSGLASGIAVVAFAYFKRGPAIIAAALVLAAVFRLVLSKDWIGMLAVRRRWVDLTVLFGLACLLIVLAWVAPQLST